MPGRSERWPTSTAGKPSISVPAAKRERCFTTAPARTTQPAPSTLPSQTIAPGSTVSALDLTVDDATVLHNSNNLALRLLNL